MNYMYELQKETKDLFEPFGNIEKDFNIFMFN